MILDKIRDLIKKEETPLYVFDTEKARQRILTLRESLPENVELCYAIKANTFILKDIEDVIDYFEICSPGEFRICKKAKLSQGKYVISGVYKEPHFIEELVSKNEAIGCYTVESINQFVLLRNAAVKAERKIRVLLRLTSGNQFGLDQEALISLIDGYRDDRWLSIVGIQYFTGTQKKSEKKLKREIEYLDRIAAEIYERFAFHVEKLEYGPGFPVSYFENDDMNESAFLQTFSQMLKDMRYDGKLTLELGRSIAASCGTYMTSVVDTKTNDGEHYAIVDGGMHQMVYYGQSMAMKHPKIRLLKKEEQKKNMCQKAQSQTLANGKEVSVTENAEDVENQENWNICGSLCTVNDFLVKRYPMPAPDVGDVLLFDNTGAYCITEGIALFLSREMPAVILVDADGDYRVVRERIQTEFFNAPMTD